MKIYLILLLVLLFSILQVAFLPFNLVLLLVLFFAVLDQSYRSLLMAFYSGLILDLARGSLLGFSPLIFLITVFILLLYSARFETSRWFFLPIFVFLISTIENLIRFQFFNWKQALVLTVLAALLTWFLKSFPIQKSGQDFRLKV